MKGRFFGAEQIRPGLVGLDYDDDYYEVSGTLVPLVCTEPDWDVPWSDTSGGAWEAHEQIRAYAWAVARSTPCSCGAARTVVHPRSWNGRLAIHALVVRCPVSHAYRRSLDETGSVYWHRPCKIELTAEGGGGTAKFFW